MTYTTRIRSNPGSEITAEYECPHHGRFTVTVTRNDDGDPPETIECLQEIMWGRSRDGCCHQLASWRPSAPGAIHVKRGEIVRGKSGERPPDRHVMDTRPLADGMPLEEFKARRAMVHRDESLRRVRSALGRGRKVWG